MNVIEKINSSYPISDDTIRTLKENVTLCHFPKKYQLIKADMFCKSAYFIEKGMTRSFWLVNGEEITTSFSDEGELFSAWTNYTITNPVKNLWKHLKTLLLIEYH